MPNSHHANSALPQGTLLQSPQVLMVKDASQEVTECFPEVFEAG